MIFPQLKQNGMYLYNIETDKEVFYVLDHPTQIRKEIVSAFRFKENIYVCYLFNTNYVKLKVEIDKLIEKYKYHKYECLKLSNENESYETIELSFKDFYKEEYNIQPYRCQVHLSD